MTQDPQPRAAPATLAASAAQPDPAAHTAWINRIRELRRAGHTLDEARAIAGPMPGRRPDLDALATAITYSVLLAAFAELGVTRRAFDLSAEAVLATDAIESERSADARTVRD